MHAGKGKLLTGNLFCCRELQKQGKENSVDWYCYWSSCNHLMSRDHRGYHSWICIAVGLVATTISLGITVAIIVVVLQNQYAR